MDEETDAPVYTTPSTPGAKLRAAREASGRSIEDLATQTRVPVRLIDALERDAYDEMPAGPYATGFARSLARALGLNDQDIVAEVRNARQQHGAGITAALQEYEPVDSGRIPGKTLAWTTGILAILIGAGFFAFNQWANSPAGAPPATEVTETAPPAPAAAASSGQSAAAVTPVAVPPELVDAPVRISASERVWFSLEDANGRGQFDLTLNPGEFYTVKPQQRTLFLRTNRPQALRVLIGDQRLPQLGANDASVSGIGLDAQSLVQRLQGQTPPAPAATTGGAPTTPAAANAAAAPASGA